MKRLLPFLVLLLVLAGWLLSFHVRDEINNSVGHHLSSLAGEALRSGSIDTANALLLRASRHWHSFYAVDGFYYRELPLALGRHLGDSMLAITDTIKAKRFITAVDHWPWPLREMAISRMSLRSESLVGKRMWYAKGLDGVFRPRRYILPTHAAKERARWLRESWEMDLASINFLVQGMLAFNHAAGIGLFLVLTILAQWLIVRRRMALGQFFTSFRLPAAGIWGVLTAYVAWIVLYIAAGVTLQKFLYDADPHLFGTYTPQISGWYYGTGSVLAFTLFLFCVTMIVVRKEFDSLRTRGGIESPAGPGIYWYAVLDQYKYFLWRLWPTWIVVLVFAILLARHGW